MPLSTANPNATRALLLQRDWQRRSALHCQKPNITVDDIHSITKRFFSRSSRRGGGGGGGASSSSPSSKPPSEPQKLVQVKSYVKLVEGARILGISKNQLAEIAQLDLTAPQDGDGDGDAFEFGNAASQKREQKSRSSGFAVIDAGTGRTHIFRKKNDIVLSFATMQRIADYLHAKHSRSGGGRGGGSIAATPARKKSKGNVKLKLELDGLEPQPVPSAGLHLVDELPTLWGGDKDVGDDAETDILLGDGDGEQGMDGLDLAGFPPLSAFRRLGNWCQSDSESVSGAESGSESGSAPGLAEFVDTDRVPVVVVLGHIDHGKTSLLDYIAGTDVTSFEVTSREGFVRMKDI